MYALLRDAGIQWWNDKAARLGAAARKPTESLPAGIPRQTTFLRTYAEHYSAVMNADFDFIPYLDTLKRDGMNLTRVFLIGYSAAFDAVPDPLSPTAAGFIQPWPRATTGGNALDGLKKWDMSVWNEGYFTRLKAFAQACSDRGIVVEFTFFSTFYKSSQWQRSPLNPSNNVQGYGTTSYYDVYRPVDSNLMAAQTAAVRRITRELNEFDNIYFETQNEPFWNEPNIKDDQDVAFQNAMLAAIRAEELPLNRKHLVAHNFPQQLATMSNNFDIINAHYPFAVPSTTVVGGENLLENEYTRGKLLSLDEANSATGNETRLESWMFILGGGGIYSGVDAINWIYSVAHPSGELEPGIASRTAVRNLGTYADNLNLTAMRRDRTWMGTQLPAGSRRQGMSAPGQQYVAYLHHGSFSLPFQTVFNPIDTSNHVFTPQVTLPAGNWRAVWTRPSDLTTLQTQEFSHAGGAITLNSVTYQEDVALRIDRTGAGDLTPPPFPKGLTAQARSDSAIQLSWNPVQAADLACYHVYRSTDSAFPVLPANRVAVIPAGTTTLTDAPGLLDATHHYLVTAVDLNGNESAASLRVSAYSEIKSQPFGGTPSNILGLIQCENFDTGGQAIAYNDLTLGNAGGQYRAAENVDLEITTDSGGGYQVGGTQPGEWLDYTVLLDKAGTFDMSLRCANTAAGGQVRLEVDGIPRGGVLQIPATGGSADWQTVTLTGIPLSKGKHALRLNIVSSAPGGSAGWFNWMSFADTPQPGPIARAGPDQTLSDANNDTVETVTLNAGESVAGENPIISYSWHEGFLEIATGINPSLYLTVGTHQIQLTTTDSEGMTDTDYITVSVLNTGLTNGSFELNFSGWTTTGNANFSSLYQATSGSLSVVFNTNISAPNGTVSQAFPTTAGQTYRLSFDMGVLSNALHERLLQVQAIGTATNLSKTFSAFGTDEEEPVWTTRSLSFTADSATTTLVFRDLSAINPGADLLLDHVRIIPQPPPGVLAETVSVTTSGNARQITMNAPEAGLYLFQRSTNLTTWETLHQIQVTLSGPIGLTDTNAAGTRNFYRIALAAPAQE